MRTTNLDRIITSAPSSKMAAMVTARSKDNYELTVQQVRAHHDIAPQTKPIPKGAANLIGLRKGRLKVVGYLGKICKNKSVRWLVRCDCGHYEHRSAKSIGNSENLADSCLNCARLIHLRFSEYCNKTPKNIRKLTVADFL